MHPSPSDKGEKYARRPLSEIGIVAGFFRLSYRFRVIWIAGTLHILSLCLPTFGESFGDAWFGIQAFLVGVSAIASDAKWEIYRIVLAVSWCLNPSVWLGMVLMAMGRSRLAACAGGLGVAFGLVCVPWFWSGLVTLPGYWVWLASAASLLAFGWYPTMRQGDAG